MHRRCELKSTKKLKEMNIPSKPINVCTTLSDKKTYLFQICQNVSIYLSWTVSRVPFCNFSFKF